MRESLAGAETKEGAELGELLFDTRGCAACHTLEGVSAATLGPDLTQIAGTASAAELRQSIAEPDAVISTAKCGERECTAGLMPRFAEILDPQEIEALVSFLTQYSAGRP